MATVSKRAPRGAKLEAMEPFEQITGFNSAAMDFLTRAGGAYLNGVSALNNEVTQFVSARLNHDAQFGRSLAECRSLSDATELQQDWMKRASEEYFAEAGKLFEIASKMTIDSWKPVQEQANKALVELNR